MSDTHHRPKPPRQTWPQAQIQQFESRFGELYRVINRRLAGYPSLLYRIVLTFGKHEGTAMAASLAYYTLFSFFPLLVLLLAISSNLLTVEETKTFVLELVTRFLPGSVEMVSRNVDEVLRQKNALGTVALMGLLWSSSGVFGAIDRALNRAWGETRPTPFWEGRLVALGATVVIGLLFFSLLALSTALSVVQTWRLPILGWQVFLDPAVAKLMGWLSALVSLLASIGILGLLYRILPRTSVTWRDVWPGGIAAGIAWQIARLAFTWYLGYSRYNVIYGSVGTIIVFLVWAYLSALILLWGAEFTAQYARWRRAGRPVDDRLPWELRRETA